MIIPSIDLINGRAVQLVGGEEPAIDAGDPRPVATRFSVAGEIALIDLDAARGEGSNRETIRDLLSIGACRVGGGIRDVETAIEWLDAGAGRIILGTAARPEILRELPRERIMAALDGRDGKVMVRGWRQSTGAGIIERMRELREFVGGFLVTFIEREGRMGGIDLEQVEALREECGDARLTVAGGIATLDEIAALDRMNVDAQVGMALYTGRLHLADAIVAPMLSDRRDGLWPAIVTDERGTALGLVFSDLDSVRAAIESRRGVYRSRSRGVWIKGETSGNTQDLLRIDLDCDRDCLRFTVRQHGAGFCHRGTRTCFGGERGLDRLGATIRQRRAEPLPGSYTARLLDDPTLLREKLLEEGAELAEAGSREEVVGEAADLIYFTLVAAARAGVDLADIESELDRRALRISRRRGDARTTRGVGE